jgi:hypothetical protein
MAKQFIFSIHNHFSSFFLGCLGLSPATYMAAKEIVPSLTALFLLDLQVTYAQRGPSLEALMTHTASIVKEARSKGITIAHCRVAFTDSEIVNVPDTNRTFSQLRHNPPRAPIVNINSTEAAFHPAVAPKDGDIVVRKDRVGPFFNAPHEVHVIFKARGIDTLLPGGVSTGSLRRHFFLFPSNAVSQHRRSAQALLTLALPSA